MARHYGRGRVLENEAAAPSFLKSEHEQRQQDLERKLRQRQLLDDQMEEVRKRQEEKKEADQRRKEAERREWEAERKKIEEERLEKLRAEKAPPFDEQKKDNSSPKHRPPAKHSPPVTTVTGDTNVSDYVLDKRRRAASAARLAEQAVSPSSGDANLRAPFVREQERGISSGPADTYDDRPGGRRAAGSPSADEEGYPLVARAAAPEVRGRRVDRANLFDNTPESEPIGFPYQSPIDMYIRQKQQLQLQQRQQPPRFQQDYSHPLRFQHDVYQPHEDEAQFTGMRPPLPFRSQQIETEDSEPSVGSRLKAMRHSNVLPRGPAPEGQPPQRQRNREQITQTSLDKGGFAKAIGAEKMARVEVPEAPVHELPSRVIFLMPEDDVDDAGVPSVTVLPSVSSQVPIQNATPEDNTFLTESEPMSFHMDRRDASPDLEEVRSEPVGPGSGEFPSFTEMVEPDDDARSEYLGGRELRTSTRSIEAEVFFGPGPFASAPAPAPEPPSPLVSLPGSPAQGTLLREPSLPLVSPITIALATALTGGPPLYISPQSSPMSGGAGLFSGSLFAPAPPSPPSIATSSASPVTDTRVRSGIGGPPLNSSVHTLEVSGAPLASSVHKLFSTPAPASTAEPHKTATRLSEPTKRGRKEDGGFWEPLELESSTKSRGNETKDDEPLSVRELMGSDWKNKRSERRTGSAITILSSREFGASPLHVLDSSVEQLRGLQTPASGVQSAPNSARVPRALEPLPAHREKAIEAGGRSPPHTTRIGAHYGGVRSFGTPVLNPIPRVASSR